MWERSGDDRAGPRGRAAERAWLAGSLGQWVRRHARAQLWSDSGGAGELCHGRGDSDGCVRVGPTVHGLPMAVAVKGRPP